MRNGRERDVANDIAFCGLIVLAIIAILCYALWQDVAASFRPDMSDTPADVDEENP